MSVDYMASFEDFKDAQKTFIRSRPKRRFFFHLQMWGLLVIGLCIAICLHYRPEWFAAFPRIVLAGVLGGLIGGGVVAPLLRPWQLRRTYQNLSGGTADRRSIHLALEDGELISRITGRSEGRFRREAICETSEDDRMLLVFVGKNMFLYLPKAKIGPEMLLEIRNWLATPQKEAQC